MPPRPTTTAPSPALPALARGMLVRIERPGEGGDQVEENLPTAALTFQYNPELITRSRAGRWEARSRRNRSVGTPQDLRARDGSGSGHLLAESETISLKIMFDASEQRMAGEGADGILPELAFLENTSMGRARSRGLIEGESTQPVRPDELLLVLGPKRAFPVVLTSITMVEQKFAPDLTPIRAEVDLRFNVLEPVDIRYNTWVEGAFQEVVRRRTSLSQTIETASTVGEVLQNALAPSGGQGSADAAAPASPGGEG